MVTIVQQNEPVLREVAQTVPQKDITSPRVKKIIKDMRDALGVQKDGVAIAAPQIGIPLRIFVVSALVLAGADEKYKDIKDDLVCINPVLSKLSRKKEEMEEGCLSVRWIYGRIKRSVKVSLRAHDESGKIFERGASGLLAQVFQHETDHLDGILFIDKAYNMHEYNHEDQKSHKSNEPKN